MGASQFVGRVGGLAAALGVGVALFSGVGVASADRSAGGDSRGSTASSSDSDSASQSASPTRGRGGSAGRAPGAAASTVTAQPQSRNSGSDTIPDALDLAPVSAPAPAPAAAASVAAPAAAQSVTTQAAQVVAEPAAVIADTAPEPVAQPAPAAAVVAAAAAAEETVAQITIAEPETAPANEVSVVATAGDGSPSDGAGADPATPVDSPLFAAFLALASRRNVLSAASSNSASVTSSLVAAQNGITVDPTVTFVDGIIRGTLQATSTRGLEMTYKFVDSSAGGKLALGTVPTSPTETDPQSYTILPYATWLDGGTKGQQQFSVRVSEVTDFDKFITNIPLIGMLAAPVIDLLQKTPFLGSLLAPIIGASVVATIDVNVGQLAPGATPLAYTYKVTSFDGTKISTNFFPAAGLEIGEKAPTVLNQPGLGSPGVTNPYATQGTEPYTIGVGVLRDAGYNVLTWDPRGCFDSGGILQLDNPFFEGRDASAIISFAAAETPAQLDAPGDPKVGMVGGSYGGAIQLVTAGTDPRVDAIVPGATWDSLNLALYPEQIFKTAWANILYLYLTAVDAKMNSEIPKAIMTGNLFSFVSQTAQAVLSSSGPTTLLNKITAPTLLFQGTIDALFTLQQSILNAQRIVENPFDVSVKMTWFCGGHGACLVGNDPQQYTALYSNTLAWLATYVAGIGDPAEDIPVFQWYDQYNNPMQGGAAFTSTKLPFEDGFNKLVPYATTDDGGKLRIRPFMIGGSGPLEADGVSWPASWTFATEAKNAINVALSPEIGEQIVGAPTLSFDYSGWGNAKALYAQIVDNKSGLVVGNAVVPVPVTLDGKTHTATIQMADIAYTVYQADSMTLQITSAASIYANSRIGSVDISNIKVALPLHNPLV